MIERFRKNWNIFFSMAIGNLGIANMMLLIEREVYLSLIMFAIVGMIIGIGALYNQNKETKAFLIKLIVKDREDIICHRMEDLKNGKTKALTQEELDELLDYKK